MKLYINLLVFFIIISCATPQQTSTAKSNYSENEIGEWVKDQQFTFKATTALPSIGSQRYLTSEYDVQVAPDSLISYLPYFGRAYRAPVDPTKGGIQFTSTKFEYTIEKESDGWSIMIIPKDYTDVQQMFMNISASGMANLHVISTYRQPIIFNGRIEPRKKAKAF